MSSNFDPKHHQVKLCKVVDRLYHELMNINKLSGFYRCFFLLSLSSEHVHPDSLSAGIAAQGLMFSVFSLRKYFVALFSRNISRRHQTDTVLLLIYCSYTDSWLQSSLSCSVCYTAFGLLFRRNTSNFSYMYRPVPWSVPAWEQRGSYPRMHQLNDIADDLRYPTF